MPLMEQDVECWRHDLISMAEHALSQASRLHRPGRFQLEAAIQSAHAAARLYGHEVRNDVVALYEALLDRAPSTGAETGYAAALSNAGRDTDALLALERMDTGRTASYQPYWAVRAHVLKRLGDERAGESYDRAIGLSTDDAARLFLQECKSATEIR